MNKKTISNTHFGMGEFALQSQKCANFMPIYQTIFDKNYQQIYTVSNLIKEME